MDSAVIVLVIAIVVFLIFREVWCWYWKINEAIKLLQSIDESLKQLPAVARNR